MMLASGCGVELITPPQSLLPDKKRPGDCAALHDFLLDQAKLCNAAVIAIDLLVYGGLIPSRLHHLGADEVLERLEKNIQNIQSVTAMLDNGHTPEDMLAQVLEGLELEIVDTLPAHFSCNCSKERIEKAIISIGKKDIQSMIDDGKDIEVKCHFCNTAYNYTVDELKELLKKSR